MTFGSPQNAAMKNVFHSFVGLCLEAQTVFYDEFAVQFFDDEHSGDEERFLLLGMSTEAQLLLVCHCERDSGHVIRIISARKATKRESTFYGGGTS